MTIDLHVRYVAELVQQCAHVLDGSMGVGGGQVDGQDVVYDRSHFQIHHLHQRL